MSPSLQRSGSTPVSISNSRLAPYLTAPRYGDQATKDPCRWERNEQRCSPRPHLIIQVGESDMQHGPTEAQAAAQQCQRDKYQGLAYETERRIWCWC
ncbi:hypothetical protein CH63R_02777 [Colletotrichum higginsianum IMI 349063]|uniref:Uncharacterized protein n=1 Tax=Colletotrichum higginsianum (strain IMI 349063) TaxID=759273 RepID=A0A1B7YPU3_COLHI|nr:hypothetical protein CH63R_02777 [Colletotrichum higginsianum IMI 349063]OBR14051.1 hypothetical protein CH63R_02777 [Colletotrichum higginsianum IMI 349063]